MSYRQYKHGERRTEDREKKRAHTTVPAFDVVVGSVLSGDEVEVAVPVAVCPLVFVPAARVAVAVMEGKQPRIIENSEGTSTPHLQPLWVQKYSDSVMPIPGNILHKDSEDFGQANQALCYPRMDNTQSENFPPLLYFHRTTSRGVSPEPIPITT